MKNAKIIEPCLTSLFVLNRMRDDSEEKENIDKILKFMFSNLFGANTNLLELATIGFTQIEVEEQVKELLTKTCDDPIIDCSDVNY